MSTLRQAGINKYFFDMANIRDQCSWVHPTEPGLATEKSKRLMRMAVANASETRPLSELEFDVDASLLIIGGGVAGMTAALEAAKQGFGVYLVEQQESLGGHARSLRWSFDRKDISLYVEDLKTSVMNNDQIKVYLNSVVVDQKGFIGSFESEIMTPSGGSRKIKHGAILVATGAEEYRPELYGLDKVDNVVTQTDFEMSLYQSDPSNSYKHVVMLQCAGSRDADHLNYCSRVCCNQAVKNALRFKDTHPDSRVDILYRDMRCYGLGELYYRQARLQGINFIRFDPEENPPNIKTDETGIEINITDPSIGMQVFLKPDLLVLSTGIKARDTEELASLLRIPRNQSGFYIEAHAKLRPVDLPSEGLYMAGTAHAPKDITETIAQAQAAVARATTVLSKKTLKLSGVVSTVDPTHCAVCLTCVRACPYGVPFINDQHTAEINPALCQGCGICVAECPAKAITLGRYLDNNIVAKLEAYSNSDQTVS
jgi:heterodisulfide reductase subunit A